MFPCAGRMPSLTFFVFHVLGIEKNILFVHFEKDNILVEDYLQFSFCIFCWRAAQYFRLLELLIVKFIWTVEFCLLEGVAK